LIGAGAQAIVCGNLLCGTVNRRAIDLLAPEVLELLPHEWIGDLFTSSSDVGIAPIEPENGLTTGKDWEQAWEEVRAA
jgi:hypothetical protein